MHSSVKENELEGEENRDSGEPLGTATGLSHDSQQSDADGKGVFKAETSNIG